MYQYIHAVLKCLILSVHSSCPKFRDKSCLKLWDSSAGFMTDIANTYSEWCNNVSSMKLRHFSFTIHGSHTYQVLYPNLEHTSTHTHACTWFLRQSTVQIRTVRNIAISQLRLCVTCVVSLLCHLHIITVWIGGAIGIYVRSMYSNWESAAQRQNKWNRKQRWL